MSAALTGEIGAAEHSDNAVFGAPINVDAPGRRSTRSGRWPDDPIQRPARRAGGPETRRSAFPCGRRGAHTQPGDGEPALVRALPPECDGVALTRHCFAGTRQAVAENAVMSTLTLPHVGDRYRQSRDHERSLAASRGRSPAAPKRHRRLALHLAVSAAATTMTTRHTCPLRILSAASTPRVPIIAGPGARDGSPSRRLDRRAVVGVAASKPTTTILRCAA